MSTRSAIIRKREDGKYEGIYCHFDGYKTGVGVMLLKHYTDPDKVKRLIALGWISSLGERVEPIGRHSYDKSEEGTTVAYHRDRGEEKDEPTVGKTINEVAGHIGHNGYVYVFKDGVWTCNGRRFTENCKD